MDATWFVILPRVSTVRTLEKPHAGRANPGLSDGSAARFNWVIVFGVSADGSDQGGRLIVMAIYASTFGCYQYTTWTPDFYKYRENSVLKPWTRPETSGPFSAFVSSRLSLAREDSPNHMSAFIMASVQGRVTKRRSD